MKGRKQHGKGRDYTERMADHGSPVGVWEAFNLLRGLQEDAGQCGYVNEDGAGADESPEPEGYPRLYSR